ncbi:TIGR03560 family F420-dependent LLM class oxidoreductase [Nitriliruptoraceae bacterium ZYF776]|nr:TIGR03560 family F420-dependent LLM class oxidoreductase [Profundirhabdus halotolerans]
MTSQPASWAAMAARNPAPPEPITSTLLTSVRSGGRCATVPPRLVGPRVPRDLRGSAPEPGLDRSARSGVGAHPGVRCARLPGSRDEEPPMRVCLMIEGQESVTWPQWLALARACEDAGLEGLFRSDHYQSVQGRTERSALDAWTTLAALAQATTSLRLGTMVSPTSFRHPSVLAKNVVTADHVSDGRVELGMGAGWHELEHTTYGLPFHDLGTRYDVFEEQVEIVVRQMTEDRFDFDGDHYTLEGCEARPKPVQSPKVPLIIGGTAKPRSARIAARWADEYNTVFPTPEAVRERKAAVDAACEDAGRDPLVFSMMTGCLLGASEGEVLERAGRLMALSGQEGDVGVWLDGLRDEWIVGTPEQAAERLAVYADAGLDRVFLQHQLHDELDAVGLAGEVAALVG